MTGLQLIWWVGLIGLSGLAGTTGWIFVNGDLEQLPAIGVGWFVFSILALVALTCWTIALAPAALG